MQIGWKKPHHIATILFSSEIANDHPNCLCKFCFKTKTLNRKKVPQNLIFLQLDSRCIIINKETKMWKKEKKRRRSTHKKIFHYTTQQKYAFLCRHIIYVGTYNFAVGL